ncbi:NCA2-domain-containing protein [Pisolithus croceorrhizus]|nr:NCA2-domain-containing protein [Pisolithus croceorrhizus]
MTFRFSAHYADPLFSLGHFQTFSPGPNTQVEQAFRDIDSTLSPPFSADAIRNAVTALRDHAPVSGYQGDKVSDAMRAVLLKKVMLGLYAKALDLFLDEASTAQEDSEWWSEVEQSNLSAALYLLQSFPHRILKVLQVLKIDRRVPQTSTLHLPRIRSIFFSKNPWQPSVFMITLFPHLGAGSPTSIRSHLSGAFRTDTRRSALTYLEFLRDTLCRYISRFTLIVTYPLRLVREECNIKRRENERIRNERAEVLGKLLGLRPKLTWWLDAPNVEEDVLANREFLLEFANAIDPTASNGPLKNGMPSLLEGLYNAIFVAQVERHSSYLNNKDLRRPSRLTLLWPRLLFLPPLTLYSLKLLYASRASLMDMAQDAFETLRNFLEDWLLQPLYGVYRTIRAGGDEAMIVRPESIAADLDSLERMSLALAREKLGYDQQQLAALSQQIRLGDFTPLLKIFEEDIKSPFKSAFVGTLLRSLFIQVQKAKVDIDQALAGIDKLLKSQELTFAFVGVAPAFAVVYTIGGSLNRLLFGRRAKYGGKRKRQSVWLAVRRVERLLLFQPKSLINHGDEDRPSDVIPPLTSGLLVLSLTHLRKYALTSLPARSQLREGFLEDVRDLEDPSLGRWEKLRVLDRMWRNWAHELGWHQMAGESAS